MARSLPEMCEFWFYERFGEPQEVLKRGALPLPPLGPADVAVRVQAVALNPVDLHMMRGSFASESQLPIIPGADLAGVVYAVGRDVTHFQPGSMVYGATEGFKGALSEICIVPACQLASIPQGWTVEEAASLPVALLTAHQAFTKGHLQRGHPGQSVLITRGAGGVGVYSIQLAKAMGATRIATTASAAKHDLVRGLGATEAVNYQTVDIAKALSSASFDLILDCTCEATRLLPLVNSKHGALVTITDFQAPAPIIRLRVNVKGSQLDHLKTFLDTKQIQPVLDPSGPYAFDDVIAAYQHLAKGKATGKVIVKVV